MGSPTWARCNRLRVGLAAVTGAVIAAAIVAALTFSSSSPVPNIP
jgi:hypothetical protein